MSRYKMSKYEIFIPATLPGNPVSTSVNDIKGWMSTSKLKQNPDKTEFIVFCSKRQRDRLKAYFSSTNLDSPLCPAESVKNSGVWINSDFSLSKQVQNGYKSCFMQLRDFRHVRCFFTHDASVLVANFVVSSRLDYCNSLFRVSLSSIFVNYSASKIVQLRIISNTSRYVSITPVLKKLHWLPVEHRSVFKTASFSHFIANTLLD